MAVNAVPALKDGTPRFPSDRGFHRDLKRRVDVYFDSGLSRHANGSMKLKSVTLFGWFFASYLFLVFGATSAWQVIALCLSLALATAGVGFGIQHDANHGAYSRHAWVNRALGLTLDMIGASSFLWRVKHNIAHHTYTNVDGADDDMDIGMLARLAPEQRRHRVHRLQHFYLWALYGLLLAKYHFAYDFTNLARARVAKTHFARPRRWELAELLAGKAVFFAFAFAVPALFHPFWIVLLCYLGTTFVTSVIFAVTFQLAHCVLEAGTDAADSDNRMPQSWALHQVATTVNFSPGNELVSWYAGGLNYQVEHHLFPRICHIHYPALARIVSDVCRDHGVRYNVHRSLGGALVSHWLWLRKMGRAECPA